MPSVRRIDGKGQDTDPREALEAPGPAAIEALIDAVVGAGEQVTAGHGDDVRGDGGARRTRLEPLIRGLPGGTAVGALHDSQHFIVDDVPFEDGGVEGLRVLGVHDQPGGADKQTALTPMRAAVVAAEDPLATAQIDDPRGGPGDGNTAGVAAGRSDLRPGIDASAERCDRERWKGEQHAQHLLREGGHEGWPPA